MTTTAKTQTQVILKDSLISLLLYVLPIGLMFLSFYISGSKPWLNATSEHLSFRAPAFLDALFNNLKTWGLPAIMLVVGLIEFSVGLYENKWTKNERTLDIVCFILPKIVLRPMIAYFGLKLLPFVLPDAKNAFAWVPFWWGIAIMAVADDLTQYWYHRLHHQLPLLWRFHRTHHSAPYMGMAMTSRQNIIYTAFFSQIYLTVTLTYLGLGYPALFVGGIKSLITTAAHSSIKWDKPFYTIRWLNPIGWIMERLISTPATHHAHHADTTDDGIGNYKGNFGNMFFIWDIIFGTGIITRQYPSAYGLKHYKEEEWYAQLLWPIFKSKKEGSELAHNGPVVGDEVTEEPVPVVAPPVAAIVHAEAV